MIFELINIFYRTITKIINYFNIIGYIFKIITLVNLLSNSFHIEVIFLLFIIFFKKNKILIE